MEDRKEFERRSKDEAATACLFHRAAGYLHYEGNGRNPRVFSLRLLSYEEVVFWLDHLASTFWKSGPVGGGREPGFYLEKSKSTCRCSCAQAR